MGSSPLIRDWTWAMGTWSLSRWTTREVSASRFEGLSLWQQESVLPPCLQLNYIPLKGQSTLAYLPSFDRCLGCFPLSAVVNGVARNFCVCVSVWISVSSSFECVCKSKWNCLVMWVTISHTYFFFYFSEGKPIFIVLLCSLQIYFFMDATVLHQSDVCTTSYQPFPTVARC